MDGTHGETTNGCGHECDCELRNYDDYVRVSGMSAGVCGPSAGHCFSGPRDRE